ncbi:hypothetical protein D9M72_646150 [compost metagenome]
MLLLEGQQRADFQDVFHGTGGADQHAALAHGVHHTAGLHCRRFLARAVGDQFHAEEQARAAHVADQFVALGQPPESIQQEIADRLRTLLQSLVTDHV